MSNSIKTKYGFILIESLAAFMILTLMISQLFTAMSGGLRNDNIANFYFEAAKTASSYLDLIAANNQISTGTTQGKTESGLNWLLEIEPKTNINNKLGFIIAKVFHVKFTLWRSNPLINKLRFSTIKVITFDDIKL